MPPTLTIRNNTSMLLSVSGSNGRYFVDGQGRVVLLVGAHTWYIWQDAGGSDPPTAFDYDAYLSALVTNGHNFFRGWSWEQNWHTEHDSRTWWVDPPFYERPGPGTALDGKAKYDLTTFNQDWFDRLRQRIIQAKKLGIYCSVQLFQGFSVKNKGFDPGYNCWVGHPFNASNNIQSFEGGDGGGDGSRFQTLYDSNVTAYQEAYVEKLIDTVNDLDNIIYEICNESDGTDSFSGNTCSAWQKYWIDYITTYEAGKARQHPIWFTSQWPGGDNDDLLGSDADCVSLNSQAVSDGTKVSIDDTDHIMFPGIDNDFIWTALTNGCGGILFMDTYSSYDEIDETDPTTYENSRDNLGYALALANLADLLHMVPQGGGGSPCSTGACLKPSSGSFHEYLCYQSANGNFTLDLSSESGTFNIRKINCADGAIDTSQTTTGGASRTITQPSGWTSGWAVWIYPG